MDAKKCDRCGIFYDTYSFLVNQHSHGNRLVIGNVVNDHNNYVKGFDLCKPCMTKLETFLGMNEEKESDDEKRNT